MIDSDGFGTILQGIGSNGAQWFMSEGGVQIPPFLNVGNRVIWQQDQWSGDAIENAGSDRFLLKGSTTDIRQFRMVGNLGRADGSVTFWWYGLEVAPSTIGRPGVFTSGVHVQDAVAYLVVPPGVSVHVELQFTYVNALNQIGSDDAAGRIVPSAFIELLR